MQRFLGLSPLLFLEDHTCAGEKNSESQPAVTEVSPAVTEPQPAVTDPQLTVTEQDPAGLPSPRRCVLQKGPLGFGFNLGCIQHTPGTFVSQVPLGGAGHSAGLREGDVVMEVNGQNVEDTCLEDVILLVKQGGLFLSMLVMERSEYNKLKQSQAPPSGEDSQTEDEDGDDLTVL